MVERSRRRRPGLRPDPRHRHGTQRLRRPRRHLDDSAQVVALDLPGYGEAPEPAARPHDGAHRGSRRAPTCERTSASPAVLIGHSMGAQVALEVAARHPDLTAGLVLIGPTVDPAARTAHQQVGRLLRDLAVESPQVIALGAREYAPRRAEASREAPRDARPPPRGVVPARRRRRRSCCAARTTASSPASGARASSRRSPTPGTKRCPGTVTRR